MDLLVVLRKIAVTGGGELPLTARRLFENGSTLVSRWITATRLEVIESFKNPDLPG
jgi:hypothetical protein